MSPEVAAALIAHLLQRAAAELARCCDELDARDAAREGGS
jgi:hypothetical protein